MSASSIAISSYPLASILFSKEVAQNFKEQGNEYFKGNRFREALGFYTQGIEARPTDPAIQEALLCNRAASNLELSVSPAVLMG